jgi:hypothetical protein
MEEGRESRVRNDSAIHEKCKNTLAMQEELIRLKKQNLELEERLLDSTQLIHEMEK